MHYSTWNVVNCVRIKSNAIRVASWRSKGALLRPRIDCIENTERLIKQNPHKQSSLAQDVTGRVLRELAGTATNGLADSKSIAPSLLGNESSQSTCSVVFTGRTRFSRPSGSKRSWWRRSKSFSGSLIMHVIYVLTTPILEEIIHEKNCSFLFIVLGNAWSSWWPWRGWTDRRRGKITCSSMKVRNFMNRQKLIRHIYSEESTDPSDVCH